MERERNSTYGDAQENLVRIGRCWGSLLNREDIPPHLVALMMCSLKFIRATHIYHKDNYDDAHTYLSFAEKASKERE